MIRFLVALFLVIGLPLFGGQSNYVPMIGTQTVTPVPPVANPALANFATTNVSQVLTQIVQSLGGGVDTTRFIASTNGTARSVVLLDQNTTNAINTNFIKVPSAGDIKALGTYALAKPYFGLAHWTNMNGNGYAIAHDPAGNFMFEWSIVESTNADYSSAAEHLIYSTDPVTAIAGPWSNGDEGLGTPGPLPVPTGVGFGTFYPATLSQTMIGNGVGVTNISGANIQAGTIGAAQLGTGAVDGHQASTLESPFFHIRTNSPGQLGNTFTINNTNWIPSGGVPNGMITFNQNDYVVRSTNGALINIKQFDQITVPGLNIQIIAHADASVDGNTVVGWQLGTPESTAFSATQSYTSNWFMQQCAFAATDDTPGGENRKMKMDPNNAWRMVGIGNQGAVNFHHLSNGSMIGMGIGNSFKGGLQMGANGVYFEIFSVGSNFVNGAQFLLPAEMRAESLFGLTNGTWDATYGWTNRLGPTAKIPFWSAAMFTNGIASAATNAPLVVSPTGITNTLGVNATAFLNVTNAVYVLINASRTAYYTSGVMNASGLAVPLQAGAAVTNTSGLSGRLVPL